MLELAESALMAERCAPNVAPQTLLAIIEVESRFNPLAIGVNGPAPRALRAVDRERARSLAASLIAEGVSIDLGLAQINVGNLRRLGLSLDDAFDPCRNLAAAAVILREAYAQAIRRGEPPQTALRTALSIYNTGHPRRGLTNGYVAKVLAASERMDKAARARRAPETPAQGLSAPPLSISFVISFPQGVRP